MNLATNSTSRRIIATFLGFATFGINLKLLAGQGGEFFSRSRNRIISIHPFMKKSDFPLLLSNSYSLGKKKPVADVVQSFLKGRVPFDKVEIMKKPLSPTQISLGYTKQQILYTFFLEDIPFCEFEVKATLYKGQTPAILGRIPQIAKDALSVPSTNWPDFSSAWSFLENYLYDLHPEETRSPILLKKEKCYGIDIENAPLPLWSIHVRFGDYSYKILTDEFDIYQNFPLFFHANTAQIQAYKLNAKDGNLKTFSHEVAGTGYLENTLFRTNTTSYVQAAAPRAFAEDHQFIYETTDRRFDEASVFAHANNMISYFESLGFDSTNEKSMLLKVHAFPLRNVNNALYEPGTATVDGHPAISIGDGDGSIKGLQNLATDSDVISHEYTHHIVYTTLKSTVGESLIMHEGLADFFTFAKTGDSCLGESICPESSSMCYVRDTCLRTADIDLKYNDSRYQRFPPHLKSQIISSFLWNLRPHMELTDISKLTYHALSYFVSDSGFQDFIIALLLADKDLYSANHACAITAEAKNRGLDVFLENIDCTNSESWKKEVEPTPVVEKSTSNDDSSLFSCGTVKEISPNRSQNSYRFLPFLLFLLPVFFLMRI